MSEVVETLLLAPVRAGGLAVLAAMLGGCAALYPRVQLDEPAPVAWPQAAAVTEAGGSLYRAASYRPMFEDHRARLPGDMLTIVIAEKITAAQSSGSTVDKASSLGASLSALPGVRANSFTGGRASAQGSLANTFEGKGTTQSSNDFEGSITAIVRQVLPNGHLLIVGEKQIGVNHHVDVLRFSGQVDPRSIQPGNTVASAQIGQVRLEHRGRGAQSEAQAMGWLSRVFLSVLPL